MNPAESVNERISVSDERHFGKKGIIIMIDDNGKKVSAIFKDKKNAKEFNRNKPADIKKLLQLAKKTKYPKAIDESVNEEYTLYTTDKKGKKEGKSGSGDPEGGEDDGGGGTTREVSDAEKQKIAEDFGYDSAEDLDNAYPNDSWKDLIN